MVIAAKQRYEIILIGPPCVGKTEVGKLVAKQLCTQSVSLDDYAKRFYEQEGFTKQRFTKIEETKGYPVALFDLEPALVGAVARILDAHKNCVFDLGAAHTVLSKHALSIEMAKILEPFLNIVLLMPSLDHAQSLRILRQRNNEMRSRDWIYPDVDLLKYWVTNNQNWDLATRIVPTKDLSLQKISEQVIEICDLEPNHSKSC